MARPDQASSSPADRAGTAQCRQTVFLTGASSGLGAALARVYATPQTHLILCGRDEGRLARTAEECRVRGASVAAELLDVRDTGALLSVIRRSDEETPIDLAFLNAGTGGTVLAGRLLDSPERVMEIASVNFTAAVVAATAVGELMALRRRGRIVLVGSVADRFPLPMAPTYSASKAGLAMFADAMRLRLRKHGVQMTLLSPGFIDTPMSRGVPSPKPFLMDADAAADLIRRRLARRSHRVVFPWPYAVLQRVAALLPPSAVRAVLHRFSDDM